MGRPRWADLFAHAPLGLLLTRLGLSAVDMGAGPITVLHLRHSLGVLRPVTGYFPTQLGRASDEHALFVEHLPLHHPGTWGLVLSKGRACARAGAGVTRSNESWSEL